MRGWRRRLAACAVVAFAWWAPANPADACSCPSAPGIVYPGDGAVDVPTNARILWLDVGESGLGASVVYGDGAGEPVPGTAEALGAGGDHTVRAFVPVALEAGRTVVATLPTSLPFDVYTVTFRVGAVPDTTPPVIPTAPQLMADVWRFVVVEGINECGVTPSVASAWTWMDVEWPAASDDTTPDSGTLRRLYVYSTPGEVSSPAVFVAPWHFQRTECFGDQWCGSTPAPGGEAGSTVCVRTEFEDAAGNRAGYDLETCDVREVVTAAYRHGSCEPVSRPVTDAGPSGGGFTDAGTDAPESGVASIQGGGGCGCGIAGTAPSQARGAFWLVALAVAGAITRRRTRPRWPVLAALSLVGAFAGSCRVAATDAATADGGPPGVGDRFAEAWCAYVTRCAGVLGTLVEDEIVCRSWVAQYLECRTRPTSWTAAGSTADWGEPLDRGLRLDAAVGCADLLPTADCDVAFLAQGRCSLDDVWGIDGPAEDGAGCEPNRRPCRVRSWCDGGAGCSTCRPLLSAGENCESLDVACLWGLDCDAVTSLCTPLPPTGGCAGATCAPPVLGSACFWNPDCGGFRACVGGACAERGGPGAPCDADDDCLFDARCRGGACRAYLPCSAPIGEPCDLAERDCLDGAYCSPWDDAGICEAIVPAGSDCVGVVDECGVRSWCALDGTCAVRSAEGEPCIHPRGCLEGLACLADGRCGPLPADFEPCLPWGYLCESTYCSFGGNCVPLPVCE